MAPRSMYDALPSRNMQRIEQSSWNVPSFLSDAELERCCLTRMRQAFAQMSGWDEELLAVIPAAVDGTSVGLLTYNTPMI